MRRESPFPTQKRKANESHKQSIGQQPNRETVPNSEAYPKDADYLYLRPLEGARAPHCLVLEAGVGGYVTLQDSRMVPRLRCSCTNLLISACSVWVRGRSHPGRVAGAFGRSSMAWSQTEWRGSLCDFSSSNTCLCRLYSSGTSRRTFCLSSSGTSIRSVDCMVWGWMVTLPM